VLQIKTKLNETELSVVSEQWSTISLPVSLRSHTLRQQFTVNFDDIFLNVNRVYNVSIYFFSSFDFLLS